MAELVDALASETSEETHGSSSLLGHTKIKKEAHKCVLFNYHLFLTFSAKPNRFSNLYSLPSALIVPEK